MFSRNTQSFPFSKKKGMTIVEGLMMLAIFMIATTTFYEAFNIGVNYVLNAKKRLIAVGIANERMEVLRSLPFSEVAVVGGVPDGLLNPDEYVTTRGGQFRILTSIGFVDDLDDGTLVDGTDAVPNDFKLAVIRVLWGSEGPTEAVALSSYFMPTGLETDAGGGVLSVNVIDANGLPVPNANVRIQNSTVVPAVDTTLVTGVNGNVTLVGAIASSQKYAVTVSKTGYETVATLPPYPTTAYYPTDVHMTAVNDAFTTGTIISSSLADLHIESRDPQGNSVADVNFDLEGGRVLGTAVDLSAVYGYSNSLMTGTGGSEDINDLSPGTYRLTLQETGYTFWKIDYGSNNEMNQIALDPGVNLTAQLVLINEGAPGYFIRVLDSTTGDPIEGAAVKLENTGLGYSVEKSTDQYGYAYIPGSAPEVPVNGTAYDVTITNTGYSTVTHSVTINNLTSETVDLNPI